MGKEVFSEQEASQILQRAVQLHESQGQADPYTPGITREELDRIAQEVGVSTEFLAQAIKESQSSSHKTGPLRLTEEFEHVIDGELDPKNFDVIAEVAGGGMGQRGLRQIGRSVEGMVGTGPTLSKLNVSSRHGRTKIHVNSTPFGAIMLGLYPCFIAGLMSSIGLAGSGHGSAAIATGLGFTVLGSGLFTVLLRKGHQAAQRLVEKVRSRVEEETNAALTTTSSVSTEEVRQRLDNQS